MKLRIAFTIFLLGLTTVAFAQGKYVTKARAAYISQEYCDGIEICKTAYSKVTRKGRSAKKLKGEMAYKTADCYRFTEQFREANDWYN